MSELFPPFSLLVGTAPNCVESGMYEGVMARAYVLCTASLTEDIAWYLEQLPPGCERVLDVFSGSSRIAAACAREGFMVTAVESSDDMIALSSASSLSETVSIDVFDYVSTVHFDAITAGQLSYCMFESAEIRVKLLSRLRRNIRDGGLLLFDIITPDRAVTPQFISFPVRLEGKSGFMLIGSVRDVPEIQTTNFLLSLSGHSGDGVFIVSSNTLYAVSLEQLAVELAAGGFRLRSSCILETPGVAGSHHQSVARVSAVAI